MAKKIYRTIYRTIQIRLETEGLERLALEFMCEQANKLVNCAVYAVRQGYFMQGGTGLIRSDYLSLDAWMKQIANPHYRGIAAQASQQVLKGVIESFISFDELLQMYWHGEVEKPKLPGYRKKGGMAAVSFPVQAIQFDIETGRCRLPLGNTIKAESGIDSVWIQGAWGIRVEQISEVRILPRNGEFYAEYVYKATGYNEPRQTGQPLYTSGNGRVSTVNAKRAVQFVGVFSRGKQAKNSLDPTLALGIDPGRDNWLTCVSSLGKSFIVDGHKIKSINQLYNKRIATLKEGKSKDYWDAELAMITEKRNRQMRDAVNKTARFIVNHCLENKLGTVVFGWNEGIKDGVDMGRKNNQEFTQIPTARLKNRIKELCEEYGIEFVETEESYTSKASFLDGDVLPIFGSQSRAVRPALHAGFPRPGDWRSRWGVPPVERTGVEKLEGWEPSGRRVKRGMYRTAAGFLINADCNAAANILKKVSIQLGLNVSLGV